MIDWNLVQVELEGEFQGEPLDILDRREITLRSRAVDIRYPSTILSNNIANIPNKELTDLVLSTKKLTLLSMNDGEIYVHYSLILSFI
jgi:hypothetical protein